MINLRRDRVVPRDDKREIASCLAMTRGIASYLAMTKGGAPWLLVGWEVLQDWTRSEAIRQDDWNLLEISARGETFTISINHQPVMSFTDNRLASGSVAILIDIYAQEPGQIEFDFFALQPR